MTNSSRSRSRGFGRLILRGRRRIRLVWMSATSTRFGPIVAAVAVLLAGLGWLRPWFWPESAALGVLCLGIVGLLATALAMRLPDLIVARSLDKGLKTSDALVGALEVPDDDPFATSVRERADSFVDSDLRKAMPIQLRWKPWLATGSLLVLLTALIVIANPQDTRRDEIVAQQAAVDDVADEIEKLAEELSELPDNEVDQTTIDKLNALAEEIRKTDSVEDATEKLEQAQTELLRELGSDKLSERAASDGLEQTLEQNPVAPGETAAEQLAAAAEQVDELTDEQAQELADRLDDLAETQRDGDPETAEALAEAAEALREGDSDAAAAALDAAGSAANETASSVERGKNTEGAAGEIGDQARALRTEDSPASEAPGDGSQLAGQSPSQSPGQRSGSTPGPSNGPGGGPQPGSGPGSGEDGPTVLIPDGGDSTLLGADGEQTGSGTVNRDQQVNGPTGSGTVEVPLSEVANEFAEQAGDAVDRSSLAPSEAATVERYFEALQGQEN